MNQIKAPADISRFFHSEIEKNIESGDTPVLELGVIDLPTDAAATLSALHDWRSQRTGIPSPILPVGGLGPTWIAALMRPMSGRQYMSSSEPRIAYCGANSAEYLASTSLVYSSLQDDNPIPLNTTAIPATYFIPHSQPGMSVSWDSIPFSATTMQSQTPIDYDEYGQAAKSHVEYDSTGDWLAWTTLLLALSLIILAAIL